MMFIAIKSWQRHIHNHCRQTEKNETMKLQLWILLAITVFSCNPKSPDGNTSSITDDISIEELEQKGFEVFQESPEEAIQIFKQVAINYEKQENLKKAGIINLNIANVYDEYLERKDSALIYSERALRIWKEQKDTLQMANLYKYTGLLKGGLGKIDEAQSDIHQAIRMYETKGFGQGVAVSEINLAEVYFMDENYTESEALFSKSKDFWKGNGDLSRVFTDNILGIRIHTKMGDMGKAGKLIKENEDIMTQTELDDFIKNRFQELINEIEKGANR